MKICSAHGCDREEKSSGLCGTHYQRKRRTGSVSEMVSIGDGKGKSWILENSNQGHNDCIAWPFSVGTNGYGQVMIERKNMTASRAVCILFHGKPPSTAHQAAHSCGNRLCVNAAHLRWALPVENASDRDAHGTTPSGCKQGSSKLKAREAGEIFLSTESQRKTAKLYGVTQKVVHNIRSGKSYKEEVRAYLAAQEQAK